MTQKVLRIVRERSLNSFNAKNDEDVILCGNKGSGDTMVRNGLVKTYPELAEYGCLTRCDVKNTDSEGNFKNQYQLIIGVRMNEDGSCLIREFKVEDNV